MILIEIKMTHFLYYFL